MNIKEDLKVVESDMQTESISRPLIIITGISGNLGNLLARAFSKDFHVVGTSLEPEENEFKMDVSSSASVELAIKNISEQFGQQVEAVIHLAAYFDFTGEQSALYQEVNEKGTRNLLRCLQELNVKRFIYASTMLVHEPVKPGEQINEDSAIKPTWAYPESKARTEKIIIEESHSIPYAILRLAGVYGDDFAVPTLSHQIARIYERDVKSILYAGDTNAGQAFVHQDDVVDLFKSVVAARESLPKEFIALAGETAVASYETLQQTIGEHIHGNKDWHTLEVPKPIAKVGAWLEDRSEPIVPDNLDRGEKPFIKPFMVDMASDHYALDIRRAHSKLSWMPKKSVLETLPKIIANLKEDPISWYKRNRISPPDWMEAAADVHQNPQKLREKFDRLYSEKHFANIWAPFINAMLALWLLFSPVTLGYQEKWMVWSDLAAGSLLLVFSMLSVSQAQWGRLSRWICAVIGLWLVSAPLIFWAPTSAAYLNGTLVGTLVMCFALVVRPFPHASPVATLTGPVIPPGWSFSPSDWLQRVPIIILAVFGLLISRYMGAYQLEAIDGVWDPAFLGSLKDPQNGTEEIITSSVSKAWPVPDAGLGALTYLLEIITGLIGSRARWRTMPWLVLLFGFMIVPLGAISITFIIIQPMLLGTWCTLCLIAAAAMLLQIPYSFDEIVATIEFLRRRAKQGRPWMLILFTGDTDSDEPDTTQLSAKGRVSDQSALENIEAGNAQAPESEFNQGPLSVLKEIFFGGIRFNWNLTLSLLIGVYLMCTRLIIGADGDLAHANHLIGALVLTFTITATAEVARPIRYINLLLGMALIVTTFSISGTILQLGSGLLCGFLLIGLCFPRGPIKNSYGLWTRYAKI